MKSIRRILALLLVLLLPCAALAQAKTLQVSAAEWPVTEDGWYSTMEEVAVYLHTYDRLPTNFLTKKEAEMLGWSNKQGNLGEVAPYMSIGGDYFGNYEGSVPSAKGRSWTECDINFDGGYRGAERIVFSSDGLIYYSDDHYETFTQVEVLDGEKTEPAKTASAPDGIEEDGEYLSRDEVAAYLHAFGHLPCNYMTRDEAKEYGWSSKKDDLGDVMPGCAIGGDTFGNREGLLPTKKGRTWQECDVNTTNGRRSDERLVWSSDGLIYYTPDAHRTFERLY